MAQINNNIIKPWFRVVITKSVHAFVTKYCLAQNNEPRYFLVLTKNT